MSNFASQLSAQGLIAFNPAWAQIPGLIHGITTRAALPAAGKKLLGAALAEARRAGAIPLMPTVGAEQVHGGRIGVADFRLENGTPPADFSFVAGREVGQFAETDALITTQPGILLVIQTADCLPVFLIDPEAHALGLAHCGWRGLDQGLAGALAEAMLARGAEASRLRAWLGPCIQAANYEVGEELAQKFERACPGAPVSPCGDHLDLVEVARWQLARAGVDPARIESSGECTLGLPERYHSYRRDGEGAGRMLSFLGLHA